MPITHEKHFKITSVHRDDLEQAGFDTSQIDDATMQHLASEMADDYYEQLFWDQLPIIAEILGISGDIEARHLFLGWDFEGGENNSSLFYNSIPFK